MHLLPYGFLLLYLQLQQTQAFNFTQPFTLSLENTLTFSFLFVKNNLINAY